MSSPHVSLGATIDSGLVVRRAMGPVLHDLIVLSSGRLLFKINWLCFFVSSLFFSKPVVQCSKDFSFLSRLEERLIEAFPICCISKLQLTITTLTFHPVTMRFIRQITPLLLVGLLSTAAAAPQGTDAQDPGCVVPQVVFTTLPEPFTLSGFLPSENESIPVLLAPFSPSSITIKPVLGRAKILPPSFRLEDQKLLFDGFPATGLVTLPVEPPSLEGFVFKDGIPGEGEGYNFTATYACDNTGNAILELSLDNRKQPALVVHA
jgi:hypothetical protein